MCDEEYAIPTGSTLIAMNPSFTQEGYENMSYRDLQILAKRIGVNGGGKRTLILNRIRRWHQMIKQDNVTAVNDTLVLHDQEDVSSSMLSPLKSKPKKFADGAPIGILTPSRQTNQSVKPLNTYKKFLAEKGAGLPTNLIACDDQPAMVKQEELQQEPIPASPSSDSQNIPQEAPMTPVVDQAEALKKKKKKRLSFSVFNGVKIIPARAGQPPSPPETYVHLMTHGYIQPDARENPECREEEALARETKRNTEFATITSKPAADEMEWPLEPEQLPVAAEVQPQREEVENVEQEDKENSHHQVEAPQSDKKKNRRRRHRRSGRKNHDGASDAPAPLDGGQEEPEYDKENMADKEVEVLSTQLKNTVISPIVQNEPAPQPASKRPPMPAQKSQTRATR